MALLHTSPQSVAATLNQDPPVILLDASNGRRVTAQSSSSSSAAAAAVAPLAAVYDTVSCCVFRLMTVFKTYLFFAYIF